MRRYEQAGFAVTCRSFSEYVRMFAFDGDEARRGPVLDVAGGASSFTAELAAAGIDAHAVDPMYARSADELERTGAKEIETSTEKLASMQDDYDWSFYGNLSRHQAIRRRSLARFLNHYRREKDRYVNASLPELPFEDGRFVLIVCSHFLFLYAEELDEAFHLAAVAEMMRLLAPGGEMRIYPLRSLAWKAFPSMETILAAVRELGGNADFLSTKLPFIPVPSQVLRIRK